MKSPLLYQVFEKPSRHDRRTTSVNSRFPRTDYHYQGTSRPSATALPISHHSLEDYRRELRSFREISKPIIGSGFRWQFAVEATVLGLIGVLVAWPLIYLLIVLAQTARG